MARALASSCGTGLRGTQPGPRASGAPVPAPRQARTQSGERPLRPESPAAKARHHPAPRRSLAHVQEKRTRAALRRSRKAAANGSSRILLSYLGESTLCVHSIHLPLPCSRTHAHRTTTRDSPSQRVQVLGASHRRPAARRPYGAGEKGAPQAARRAQSEGRRPVADGARDVQGAAAGGEGGRRPELARTVPSQPCRGV